MSKCFFIIILHGLLVMFSVATADTVVSSSDDASISVVAANKKDISESRQVIESVLTHEIFATTEERTRWRFDFESDDSKNNKPQSIDASTIEKAVMFISDLVEGLLWVLPIFILLLVYRYRHYWLPLLQGGRSTNNKQSMPDTVFGLDIRQQSLPDEIPQVANSMWQQGHYREAVSLLYRGAISRLFHQSKIQLSPGATEEDCLQQVSSTCSNELGQHFSELTRLWTLIAYAHRLPSASQFNVLNESWQKHYEQDVAKQ